MIVKDQHLILRATDLEISIETKTEAQVEEEGAIVLQSSLFGNIIRKLPQAPVKLSTEGMKLHLSCGFAEFDLIGQEPMEYPELPEAKGEEAIVLEAETFKEAVRMTEFAASLDESRPVFTGVLLELTGEGLHMVAMDGYRIALYEMKGIRAKSGSMIVPARTLRELIKILEDRLVIKPLPGHLLFDLGSTILITKLLDGRFIDYGQILPKNHLTRLFVDRRELLAALERASTLSKADNANLITQIIHEDQMEIRSNAEMGKVREMVPLKKEGRNLLIGFNSKYFIDGLRAMDEEEVLIDYNESLDACVMHPEEGNYQYLLLPVRLSERELKAFD